MNLDEVAAKLEENIGQTEKINFDFVKENTITDDPVKLNKAIVKHPALFAYYSALYSLAKKEVLFATQDEKELYAKSDLEIRNMAATKGGKVTEGSIQAMITNSAPYKEVKRRLLQCQSNEQILGAMVQALKERKDCIVTLSTNMRSERSNTTFKEVQ